MAFFDYVFGVVLVSDFVAEKVSRKGCELVRHFNVLLFVSALCPQDPCRSFNCMLLLVVFVVTTTNGA